MPEGPEVPMPLDAVPMYRCRQMYMPPSTPSTVPRAARLSLAGGGRARALAPPYAGTALPRAAFRRILISARRHWRAPTLARLLFVGVACAYRACIYNAALQLE